MVQQPVVVVTSGEPNLLVRIIWFLLVGWWLSQIVIFLGWLFNLTVIGLPLGIWLLNRIPQAATLKMSGPTIESSMDAATGATLVEIRNRRQRPLWQRSLFFIFVGWWFSLIWLEMAWICCILLVLMPLGFWMFGATGKVLTLKR